MMDWRRFVIEHGFRASGADLAHVLQVPRAEIEALRASGVARRLAKPKQLAELFSLWHGRPPKDDEWPAPLRCGSGSGSAAYQWLPPEEALLGTLVGVVAPREIAQTLTKRLKVITGDSRARRTKQSVLVRMNRLGLVTDDLLGGISVPDASREIGSQNAIYQAIRRGHLPTRRVGHRLVIPYAQWTKWKERIVLPPKGAVQLSKLKQPLGIRSDKLSEFARAGLIPGAMRCNPCGANIPSTQFGTWFIDARMARQLVADRRAGRKMPWHGLPLVDNLKATWARYERRRHPATCAECREIWGRDGAPATFTEFAARYPSLVHGAKRHLTRPWVPGLTAAEVAADSGRSLSRVLRAMKTGALQFSRHDGRRYVSRTVATRWKARKCPTGDSERSWISIATADEQYGFSPAQLRARIRAGELQEKILLGTRYVSRQQCADLRAEIGFSEGEAARRVGVSVARLRVLLRGLEWRTADGIPLQVVQNAIKRVQSQQGYTIAQAARELGRPEAWVVAEIAAGTVRVSRAKWDRRRRYLTQPMLERLRAARDSHTDKTRTPKSTAWLGLSGAAALAGVCSATMHRWGNGRMVRTEDAPVGRRYHRKSVMACAREYWPQARFRRKKLPAWLVAEQAGD